MAVVHGADGVSRNRWVVAEEGAGAGAVGGIRWHLVTGAAELLALADAVEAQAIALDVPIGLPASGQRRCDKEAHASLGARRSSVFMTPPRHVLEHDRYAAARAASPGLTAQAFALISRIRDVDTALRAAGPSIHARVVECHPELSFRAMTGRELARKKSARGALERIEALTAAGLTDVREAPDEAGLDDALDAMACAWTARRWADGTAKTRGGDADALGVPMRIVT
jgi:predicted RNase H-like nuclease